MYYANIQLTPTQVQELKRGGMISLAPHQLRNPTTKLVVDEKNAKKIFQAHSKGSGVKVKLTAKELESNLSDKRGGLGPLAMLAASSLIPALAPVAANTVGNIFGKLFGGAAMPKATKKRKGRPRK
jgi:hypothetical protein